MANFWCHDNKEEYKNIVTIAHKVIEEFETQIKEYQKKADDNTGKIMPVENISCAFNKRYSNIESYKNNTFLYSETYDKIAERAKKWADDTFNSAKIVHEKNIPNIENNINVKDKIIMFMHNVGIPLTRYEKDSKSRARYPKSISVNCGFIDDLNRYCIIDDGWDIVLKDYKRMTDDINKYITENEQKEKLEKQAKEAEQKKQERELQRSALVVKYNMDYTSS